MQGRARIVFLSALLGSLPIRAGADGAFPDEMHLFVPADQPHRIIVSTTFGLLLSDDDGANFRWVCEQAVTQSTALLYQVGPPPTHALFAASLTGISFSVDEGCNWTSS